LLVSQLVLQCDFFRNEFPIFLSKLFPLCNNPALGIEAEILFEFRKKIAADSPTLKKGGSMTTFEQGNAQKKRQKKDFLFRKSS